jgi:Hg(II)-responsive transcriptional regulator
MEALTIGELAKRARVNRETVRYYERHGLLARPARSAAGYRLFCDDALRRLRFIRHAKTLGFSLGEIEELLALRVRTLDACARVKQRTEDKISDIDRKIRALKQIRNALAELAATCAQRGRSEDCPVLRVLEENGRF